MKARQLQKAEWDFSDVAESELDACFYYEFARASELLKNGMASWRVTIPKLAEIKLAWLNAPTSSWAPGTIRHADPSEFEKYCEAMLANEGTDKRKPDSLAKVDSCLLDFLSSVHEFPGTPWQNLKDTRTKGQFAAMFKVPDEKDAAREPGLCLTDQTSQIGIWESMGVSIWEQIQDAQANPANARIRLTYRLLSMSWNFSDAQIVAAFRTWLKTARPPSFPEPPKARSTTGPSWQKLPFRIMSALNWLGVLRRRNAVSNWRQYFESYNPPALVQEGKTRAKRKTVSEASRPSQEDCRKAKLILGWLESGTPLRQGDFK